MTKWLLIAACTFIALGLFAVAGAIGFAALVVSAKLPSAEIIRQGSVDFHSVSENAGPAINGINGLKETIEKVSEKIPTWLDQEKKK